jgi:hypothetical protein
VKNSFNPAVTTCVLAKTHGTSLLYPAGFVNTQGSRAGGDRICIDRGGANYFGLFRPRKMLHLVQS